MKERLAAAAGRDVSRETVEKLEVFGAMLVEESQRQNLVARSTIGDLWDRHLLDSAQLVRFEPRPGATWLDVGSGAGLPGIVIACLVDGPVTLCEPRRLRADFLHKVGESLKLDVTVIGAKVERMRGRFDVITARAVAPLTRLIEISQHLSTGKTVWALPKGRGALEELAEARQRWQGAFHVEPSLTDPSALVVLARGVKAR